MKKFSVWVASVVVAIVFTACGAASSTTTYKGTFAAAAGVTSSGTGTAEATLDGDKLTVTGDFKGLAGDFTVAHLHRTDGVVFEVTVTTDADKKGGTFTGTGDLSTEDSAALKAGTLYVNIHSSEAGSGEIQAFLK